MAINKYRRIFAALLFIAVFAVFAGKMANLQLVQGSTFRAESNAVSQRTVSVSAARGGIVDRYGTPLVENHQGYALVFDGAYFPTASEQAERNKIIINLIRKLEAAGEGWNNTLPLELDKDGKPAFMEDRDSDIKKIKREDLLNLNDYATAQNCFDAIVSRYELEEYTPAEALKIGSVCLAMKEIGFGISTPYTFADDVSERTVAAVKENSVFYRGVDVEVVPYRDYTDGTTAPHLLGTVGAINAEEYAEKKDEGYSITDDIGKSGIEYAMEAYLRGKPGVKTVYTIHNIAYQGQFGASELEQTFGLPGGWYQGGLGYEYEGRHDINLMKGAILMADAVSTVSMTYARELHYPAFDSALFWNSFFS